MKWLKNFWSRHSDACKQYIENSTELILAGISVVLGITQFFDGTLLPANDFIYLDSVTVAHILGGVFLVAGVLLYMGLSMDPSDYRTKVRRTGSFLAFLAFSYAAFLGFFSDDLTFPVGVLALGLALISGFLHIKEKYVKHV